MNEMLPPTLEAKPNSESHWKSLGLFSIFALLYCAAHVAYQYYILTPEDLDGSYIRGSALAGATLISASLALSTIFKWVPRWAKYWRLRRYLGVSGVIFISIHILTVLKIFQFNFGMLFATLNPFINPLVFGAIAYLIFFVMLITSTDGMMKRLTPRVWKNIHRFVYVAYLSTVLHFLFTNPVSLKNPAGYFLIGLTAFVILTHIYWFARTVIQRGWKKWATVIGITIIVLGAFTGWYAYKTKYLTPQENIEVSN